MLRVLGSLNPFRPAATRREVLRIGGLAGLALSLPQLARLEAQSPAGGRSFGRARRVLLVYLQGAASQYETWDPKPDAPAEVRGPCGAISTAVPGVSICDGLPQLARVIDRIALVRSMSHDHNNHSNVYTLTGHPAVDFSSETNPADPRHHPFFMSVLDYLGARGGSRAPADMPRHIGLPFRFSSRSVIRRAGPYGSFLGRAFDPVWTEFVGEPTRAVPRVSFFNRLADVPVKDPFLGITPDSRLHIAESSPLRAELTLDRLDQRRSLRDQLEQRRRQLGEQLAARSLDRFEAMAYSLISSVKLRDALDLDAERPAVRERYGMNLFGQSALTARRLLEAGCRLVSVFWDEVQVVNTAWDTHYRHVTRFRDELHPGLDAGLSALLTDLEERGLLDDTLVLCLTEHGRQARVSEEKRGGGRNHWSQAYSIMLAGAGIRPGTVVGASDAQGAFVKEGLVTPQDILATVYHLAGIDPETAIIDRLNRPIRLVANGSVVKELLG